MKKTRLQILRAHLETLTERRKYLVKDLTEHKGLTEQYVLVVSKELRSTKDRVATLLKDIELAEAYERIEELEIKIGEMEITTLQDMNRGE